MHIGQCQQKSGGFHQPVVPLNHTDAEKIDVRKNKEDSNIWDNKKGASICSSRRKGAPDFIAEVEAQRAMLRHTYISVNKEMPAGPKKMVVGHSKDMDTESVYGHELAGGLEKAANYTEQAFGEIIGKK